MLRRLNKLKDHWRSRVFMSTTQVVISRQRYKIQGLGLQGQGQDQGLDLQGQSQDQGLNTQGQGQDQGLVYF